MQISISDPPKFAYFRRAEVHSLKDMAELCLKHHFSPALFANGKRNLASFEAAYCIGLDIDNDGKADTPLMSLEDAKWAFMDYRHLILPSQSHQKEKHGKVADRFRVVLFFTEPITDLDTFYATWFWCKAKWPAIDSQCKDPSRGFFKHSAVASICETGELIKPVPPAPRAPLPEVSVKDVLPGERGELGKATLKFLLNGATPGERNGSVFKAAKDFQQNLFTIEEATGRIMEALERTGTLARDFIAAEVEQTIHSAYNGVVKHEPRLEPKPKKAFNLLPIGELYKTKSELEWVVDRLLSVGGVSIISADPKAGKSTLVRQLMRDILRGGTFLDRKCKQGPVHYYAIEEQLEVVNVAFQRLGVNTTDPLLVHVGDPLGDNKMEDFRELLLDGRPVLAVIDTLFDFVDVESENNYKEVKRELRRIRKIARDTGTHILLVHHTGKGQKGDNRYGSQKILGSTAIAGGVDTTITVAVSGRKRLVNTTGREIRPWSKRNLVYDYEKGTYALGPEEDEFL